MAIEIRPEPPASDAKAAVRPFAGISVRRDSRVDSRDRRAFTEQLALLLSTGITLHASLRMLRGQARKSGMVELLDDLLDEVGSGRQLSQALTRHPAVFSSTYVNLIAAAEEGGYLPEVLQQLLDMEEKREKLQRTLVSALSYPMFLLAFALAVVVFVLVVVFPKFESLFSSIADQLPSTTKALLGVSQFLSQHWIGLLLGLAVLAWLIRLGIRSPTGARLIDVAKLRWPPFRGIYTRLYLLQALRVMGLSLQNGVGILDALRSTRDVVRNSVFSGLLSGIEQHVQNGEGIGRGFETAWFVPEMVVEMIKTGEETGNLAHVMSRLADQYERELSARLEAVARMAEPLMLLIMGAVIGLLVSSLILPIFKLSRAVT